MSNPNGRNSVWQVLLTGVVAFAAASPSAATQPVETFYTGMCEASAAVPVGDGMFLVANDEDHVLRLYRSGVPDAIGASMPIAFPTNETKKITDIEGATVVGSRIYWITSHSRNRDAEEKAPRRLFFATEMSGVGTGVRLAPVSRVYPGLIDDLLADRRLDPWRLKEAAGLAPETGFTPEEAGAAVPPAPTPQNAIRRAEGGLNIEGLAATRDGTLLIAFRSPLRNGEALIVPLENAAALVAPSRRGPARHARFGAPIALRLDGPDGRLGVRSIERSGPGDDFLISAGPVAGGGFRLFRWRYPQRTVEPIELPLKDLSAEAIMPWPGRPARIMLLSDDGDYPAEKACGDPTGKVQRFRGWLAELPGR